MVFQPRIPICDRVTRQAKPIPHHTTNVNLEMVCTEVERQLRRKPHALDVIHDLRVPRGSASRV